MRLFVELALGLSQSLYVVRIEETHSQHPEWRSHPCPSFLLWKDSGIRTDHRMLLIEVTSRALLRATLSGGQEGTLRCDGGWAPSGRSAEPRGPVHPVWRTARPRPLYLHQSPGACCLLGLRGWGPTPPWKSRLGHPSACPPQGSTHTSSFHLHSPQRQVRSVPFHRRETWVSDPPVITRTAGGTKGFALGPSLSLRQARGPGASR